MFRKSTINKQLDMFSSPVQMMGKRESNQYDDPNAWHNKFYREVTSKVDEDIFKPLSLMVRQTARTVVQTPRSVSSSLCVF